MKRTLLLLLMAGACQLANAQTYAEKLGFPKGKKVIIFHVDDAGMSYDSNVGTRKSLNEGVATSTSVMMPCGWVPEFMALYKQNPKWDVGVHLTLTSEWKTYRWQPLSGKDKAPTLYDPEGSLWHEVPDVVQHSSADDVEKEIREQIARFRQFGIEPSHIDSHMGTLFTPKFVERYVKVGIEEKIPVMFPCGHNTLISSSLKGQGQGQLIAAAQEVGKKLWASGLPVLDDLFADTGWNLPAGQEPTDENLRAFKTKKFIEILDKAQPGVTMIIVHSTDPTPVFSHFSGSGNSRKGDMLAMMDPELKSYLEKNGIVLSTFKELKERRRGVR
ncbi:MAG: polysaccharide deacetylase family protein [Siphonobacter aquaeclarae]|nr:polysaccharide deacetylase family protein [Siphonobacter aquaeclarae]